MPTPYSRFRTSSVHEKPQERTWFDQYVTRSNTTNARMQVVLSQPIQDRRLLYFKTKILNMKVV